MTFAALLVGLVVGYALRPAVRRRAWWRAPR